MGENDPYSMSGNADQSLVDRRTLLQMMGASTAALGAAGVSAPTVQAASNDDGGEASGKVTQLTNTKFITNAQGDGLPEGDELVFDTAPASIPLNEILDEDDEYDSQLFKSLNDSRQLVVKPPEGYDRESGYDESWPPLRWNDISDTSGTATVGPVKPTTPGSGDDTTGTRVNISVENAIPNGQYTIWVVKFAELKNPGKFEGTPKEAFVTPAGNGLVGFHNLGQKFGNPGKSENTFTTDSDGSGTINRFNEGGPLSGVPGYRPLGDAPVEDGPVPFVGSEDDYNQSGERLNKIQNNLRAEDQISFVGAYHYDDQTWGVYPGPWHLNQFGVSFVFK